MVHALAPKDKSNATGCVDRTARSMTRHGITFTLPCELNMTRCVLFLRLDAGYKHHQRFLRRADKCGIKLTQVQTVPFAYAAMGLEAGIIDLLRSDAVSHAEYNTAAVPFGRTAPRVKNGVDIPGFTRSQVLPCRTIGPKPPMAKTVRPNTLVRDAKEKLERNELKKETVTDFVQWEQEQAKKADTAAAMQATFDARPKVRVKAQGILCIVKGDDGEEAAPKLPEPRKLYRCPMTGVVEYR
jgi:hypothetical protein